MDHLFVLDNYMNDLLSYLSEHTQNNLDVTQIMGRIGENGHFRFIILRFSIA